MTGEPDKPPRFPYVAALLCAACLGATVWMWMRYSCARDVTVQDFYDGIDIFQHCDYPFRGSPHPLEGEYVRLRGVVVFAGPPRADATEYPDYWLCGVADTLDYERCVEVLLPPSSAFVALCAEAAKEWVSIETWGKGIVGEEAVFVGRFVQHEGLYSKTDSDSIQYAAIDTTASRFHPATIAGLMVGAMGLFVFGMAFRHWRRERRWSREKGAAA